MLISGLLMFVFHTSAMSQLTLNLRVVDQETGEGLAGIEVKDDLGKMGCITDDNGECALKISANKIIKLNVIASGYDGYTSEKFSIQKDTLLEIFLKPTEGESEVEEVVIEATRSNRSIESTPTRVEVLTEEVDEAASMDPSKVAHLLTHSTGIQVQQISATTNTANVRIQGLDGRYAQILKDGFPLYGGLGSSLSIMQIPPLDLRQVEYVKGSASTLYGAGAISGLINLLSKNPDQDETLLQLNLSQVGASDINAFMSRKTGKLGFTLLAQRNNHREFDANADGFTDLPQLTKFNLNPRFFWEVGSKGKLILGATVTDEIRQGGDMDLLNGQELDSTHFYRESNDMSRATAQLTYQHALSNQWTANVRHSTSRFARNLGLNSAPGAEMQQFGGVQWSTFSELSGVRTGKNSTLNLGLNAYTDSFEEDVNRDTDSILLSEKVQTLGLFGNYTFDLARVISFETGLRIDKVLQEQWHILPRAFALIKWSPKLTSRIGGGLGYRNASVFNQEAELLAFQGVLPIDRSKTEAENAMGGSMDIGFKSPIGDRFFVIFNQMFFASRISSPLILNPNGSEFEFGNDGAEVRTMGAETFFKLGFYDFVWFVGYTYTHAAWVDGTDRREFPLTPAHSIKGDLLYALPGKWRIGVDYEFKSGQARIVGPRTPSFWTFGGIVERTIGAFTVYVNVENFTDYRQNKVESMLTLPYATPQFTEVWGPLDGIVVNGGLKLRLKP
jgi:iron complex outermembrane receptor protein